jgi:hypothetical protein
MFPSTDRVPLALALALALPASSIAQQRHDARSAAALPHAASAPVEGQPAARAQQPRAHVYRSAFEGYRPFGDEPAVPWREANDAVGRIGGWRAYAREAQEPAAPDRAASQPAARPNAQGGHGVHQAP